MRKALGACEWRQLVSDNRVLPQLVGRSAERDHALRLSATFFAHTHARQVVVEHDTTVPLEHTPATSTVVSLPRRTVPARTIVTVIAHTHASPQLVMLLQIRMRLNVLVYLRQAQLILRVGQPVHPCLVTQLASPL